MGVKMEDCVLLELRYTRVEHRMRLNLEEVGFSVSVTYKGNNYASLSPTANEFSLEGGP